MGGALTATAFVTQRLLRADFLAMAILDGDKLAAHAGIKPRNKQASVVGGIVEDVRKIGALLVLADLFKREERRVGKGNRKRILLIVERDLRRQVVHLGRNDIRTGCGEHRAGCGLFGIVGEIEIL